MACAASCMISMVFLVGMIYFYYITDKSQIAEKYKASLSKENLAIFNKISHERMKISYEGYALGVFLSILIIFYNIKFTRNKLRAGSMVCIVVATAFLTNYFYYLLYPKSDWLLNHTKTPEETQAWLEMYKGFQYNYHMGMALGIVAVGFLAFAFRC
jgi:hypothetical protein